MRFGPVAIRIACRREDPPADGPRSPSRCACTLNCSHSVVGFGRWMTGRKSPEPSASSGQKGPFSDGIADERDKLGMAGESEVQNIGFPDSPPLVPGGRCSKHLRSRILISKPTSGMRRGLRFLSGALDLPQDRNEFLICVTEVERYQQGFGDDSWQHSFCTKQETDDRIHHHLTQP